MDRAQVETTYQRANSLYEQAKWQEALVLLDQLVLVLPRNPNIQYSRALCLSRLDRVPEARQVCDLLINELSDGRGAQLKGRLAGKPLVRGAPRPEEEHVPEPPRASRAAPVALPEPPHAQVDITPRAPRGLLAQRRVLLCACCALGIIGVLGIWVGVRRPEVPAEAERPAVRVSGLKEAPASPPEGIQDAPLERKAPSQASPGAGRGDRRLTFPQDRSMGALYVRDAGTLDEWKWLGETCGDVVIPAGKELRLDVSPDGARDPSPLGLLAPDAFVEISLRGTPMAGGALARIAGLTGLECLYLGETAVADADLVHIEGLGRLKTLDLEMTPITDAGLTHIERLGALRELSLYGTRITDAGLAHLATLTNLEGLYLGGGMAVRGEGLAYLKDLKGLKRLNLWGTEVNDGNLVHLAAMMTLEKLNLGLTQVTDAGLVHLAGLVALRELNLGQTQVTGAGFANLAGLPALSSVDLHQDRLSQEGTENLARLTRLRDLNVAMAGLDDAALAGLRAALPDCTVIAR